MSVNSYFQAPEYGAELKFKTIGSGAYLDLGGEWSLDGYEKLLFYYWPGSCQRTGVYFDSFTSGMQYLDGSSTIENGFVVKEILLSDVLDTKITQSHKKIASRLVFKSGRTEEVCLVYRILAK